MKKHYLTKAAFVTLLLSSTLASAETEYPATNFKPVIVFQDQNANETSKKNESAVSKPVAKAASAGSSEYSKSESVSEESTPVATKKSAKEEKSNINVLIGLGVLAAAGLFFFTRKKASTTGSSSDRAVTGETGVERYLRNRSFVAGTGVARYLDKKASLIKEKAESTGVSKYLKEKAQSPRTVAASASPRGTVGGATGVAKYLRDKG